MDRKEFLRNAALATGTLIVGGQLLDSNSLKAQNLPRFLMSDPAIVQNFYNELANNFKTKNLGNVSAQLTDDFTATQLDSSVANKPSWMTQIQSEFARFDFSEVEFKVMTAEAAADGSVSATVVRKFVTGQVISTISTKDLLVHIDGNYKLASQILTNRKYNSNGNEYTVEQLATSVALLQGCEDDVEY